MNNVATFLRDHLAARLAASDPTRALIVMGGLPEPALEATYRLLTSDETAAWRTPVGAGQPDVPVLLIPGEGALGTARPGALACARCTWDYAVNARSSCPVLVVLASPLRAAEMPESIANAASVAGAVPAPASGRGLRRQLSLLGVPEAIETLGGSVDRRAALGIVAGFFDGSAGVPTDERLAGLWNQLDLVLGATGTPEDIDLTIAGCFGLLSGADALDSAEAGRRAATLHRLGDFLSENGIETGIRKLAETNAAADQETQQALGDFKAWLFAGANVTSAAAFERSARWFLRQPATSHPWWLHLQSSLLASILDEAGATRRAGRVEVTVTNALGDSRAPDDQPWIVRENADLRITPKGDVDMSGSAIYLGTTELATLDGTPPHAVTLTFPVAPVKAPAVVRVDGPNIKAESAHILSLARFEPHCFLEFPDGRGNPGPSFRDDKWTQQVTLARGGMTRAKVHLAAPAAIARLVVNERTNIELRDGEIAQLDLEEESAVKLTSHDAAGMVLAEICILVALESADDSAEHSYFDALLQAHRIDRNLVPPDVPDLTIRRIEGSMLNSADSWRPLLGCVGPATRLDARTIDWADPRLGDTAGVMDVRPRPAIPPALAEAREQIRQRLLREDRTIPDIDLGQPDISRLAAPYLSAYLAWLTSAPDDAVWQDCIVLHAAIHDHQSGTEVPSAAPIAILLSPLHPIRFAWHCEAQRILRESLDQTCPIAALLASGSTPDAGAWKLGTSAATFTPFFARACSDAYWSVMWNSAALHDASVAVPAEGALGSMGLPVASIAPGFDAAQVRHALHEVATMLSARSTLRCAIASAPSRPVALAKGVFDWVSSHFEDGTEPGLPHSVEIYDGQEDGLPDEELLGFLSRIAEGRVRWFRGKSDALDLAIIDQLSTGMASAVPSPARSVIGAGALTRIRIRSDADQARRLTETRVAMPLPNGSTMLDRTVVAFEDRAAQSATRATALESQPNQQAIGRRLEQAQLVAITSAQIDLACLTRGIEAQQGYLWDYEIPSLLDANQRAGYYLVARPGEGMRRSIEIAIKHLADREPTPDEVLGVLREVSRRGIPVLKRVAEGGSHARGELGALIAARFLQDTFRPGASRAGLPVHRAGLVTMLMPVDPFEDVFAAASDRLTPHVPARMRPDFLAFCIRSEGDRIAVRITPVEVKYRGDVLPTADRKRAYDQAKNFADLLRAALINPPNEAWQHGGAALIAECIDYAFRLHASDEVTGTTADVWAVLHQGCLQQVLARNARIEIHTTGVVIAIQADPTSPSDFDQDGVVDGILLGPADTASIYQRGVPFDEETSALIAELRIQFAEPGTAQPPAAELPQPVPPAVAPTAPAPALPPTMQPLTPAATPAAASQVTTAAQAMGTPGGLPPEVRAQVNAAFEGFVGNQGAVSILTRDALFGRMQQPVHLRKAFLLTGSPSTGKTTLAVRFANAIGLPVVTLDGKSTPLKSREALFDAINAALISRGQRPVRRPLGGARAALDYPPFLLFIDEVHLVPRGVQESLLTMVENDDRTAVIDANRTAHVPMATFVFATTRASDVDGPLRTRCEEVQLRDYEAAEVAEITRRQFPAWPIAVHERLAVLGRRVPRISLELSRSLHTEIIVNGNAAMTVEQHLNAVADSKRIDALGLTPTDRQYLSVLRQQRRAVGRDQMVHLMSSVDKNRITEEIEPYLSSLEFIRFTGGGREITPAGARYLDGLRGVGPIARA